MEIRKIRKADFTANHSHGKHKMLDKAIKAVDRARNLMEELMWQQQSGCA